MKTLPIYSRTISDSELLNTIPEGSERILIVACGGCMNESLAYDHHTPITQKLEDGNLVAYSVRAEAERVANILNCNGFTTKIVMPSHNMLVLCISGEENYIELFKLDYKPDCVLVLSCDAGVMAVRRYTDSRVFNISRQCGFLSFSLISNENYETMDYSQSTAEVSNCNFCQRCSTYKNL